MGIYFAEERRSGPTDIPRLFKEVDREAGSKLASTSDCSVSMGRHLQTSSIDRQERSDPYSQDKMVQCNLNGPVVQGLNLDEEPVVQGLSQDEDSVVQVLSRDEDPEVFLLLLGNMRVVNQVDVVQSPVDCSGTGTGSCIPLFCSQGWG